jgi:hypothetical protein
MTPQEQQLVADLFQRLASLEGQRRDPDAERLIREGLGRAPNSVYALVQSVLVQDEALKRANARIQELEQPAGGAEPAQGGGFLDTMRNALMGEKARGSVPSVRPGGQGSSGVWGPATPAAAPAPPAGYPAHGGYPAQPGYPAQMAPPMGAGMGGGSFLGTAAAAVAGVIGGGLMLDGIRSMMGGHHGMMGGGLEHPQHHAAWDAGGDGGGGNLERDAGLGDIGGHRSAAYDDSARSGLFGGGEADDQPDDDGGSYDDAGDFGGDDSDSA